MPITVARTLLGMDALAVRMESAIKQITADAAHIVQTQSMMEAPVGVTGNSTNAPGDLRRSIDVQGPVGGGGTYHARVGPTVIYGRQRELGGPIYPQRAAALRFEKFGTVYYSQRVFQTANPYMLRGEAAAIPQIDAVARERVARAIMGR